MKDRYEARLEELRKRGNKGFTLMEMLIVVAIIAVLVAIAIPIFNGQLENSREATDAANIRSAYAEVAAAALLLNGEVDDADIPRATIQKEQQVDGWQNTGLDNIAGVAMDDIESIAETVVEADYDETTGWTVLIDGDPATTTFMD